MKAGRLAAVLVLSFCHGVFAAGAEPSAQQVNPLRSLEVSDHNIRVTSCYAGKRVGVWGRVEPGCAVAVKLTSPDREVTFSRMGKVGPFWMSVGRVRFGNVPRMYKISTSDPLDEILSSQEQLRYRLGLRGLRASLTAEGGTEAELHLDELIAARKAGGLFSFREGGVTCREGRYSTNFFWPCRVASGRYTIEAFAIRGRRVVGTRSLSIEVHEVGIEAFVSNLARSHGVLYGLGAVGLAAVVGLLMCLVFDFLGNLGAIHSARKRNRPKNV
ncbi:MAG: TIGR02186 family protein [Acidobacteria bacterium]|nr:TIGR02186 family protein [Acidobacteriota bacterium]